MAGEHSVRCPLAGMDLFPPRVVQSSVKDSQVVACYPAASIEHGAPVKFILSGTTQSYILLDPKLACTWQITNADDSPLSTTEALEVAFLNLLHGVAWNSIEVLLNQVALTAPNNLAHIVAYLQANLSYTQDVKKRSLQRELFYPDEPGKFDSKDNTGFKSRKALCAGGKRFESIGKIYHPLFNTGSILPSGVEVTITLHRSPDSYVILDLNPEPTGTKKRINYKLKLVDAVLYVTRITPTDKQLTHDLAELERGPCRIFFPKVDVKSLTIPNGVSTKSFHSLYTGLIPKRVFCVLLPNVTAKYTTNGLEFKHFNTSTVSLIIGARRYPAKDYQLDFSTANNLYMRAFDGLFEALNLSGNAADIGFDYEGYGKGNFIIGWDLTSSQCSSSSDHYDDPMEGDLSLEIAFSSSTTTTINVIMCSEFVQTIEIDKFRNVTIRDE